MKKKYLAVIITLVLIFAVSMSACATYDKDVSVVLNNGGKIQDTYTISIFKNCILPGVAKDTIPAGKEFLGWATTEDATEAKYVEKDLVRYDDVKDIVKGSVVTLYAVFGNKPVEPVVTYDLVIGWYAKSATSGLNETIMASYETALKTYLTSQGKDVSKLKIAIRPYDGDVATSCGDILKAGDVNVLFGWGGNLTSTGGITAIARASGIKMSGKSRYIDLIAETELARLVFTWSSTDAAALAVLAG